MSSTKKNHIIFNIFIIYFAITFSTVANNRVQLTAQSHNFQYQIDSIIIHSKANIGVAINYCGENICLVNAEEKFPMMSVFKLHQAVAILDTLNGDTSLLDKSVPITADMLRKNTYSPLRDKYPRDDIQLSIKELLHYTLWLSDNNACDILFDMFGSTAYTNQHMAELGLLNTQIKWNENELHINNQRCGDNYTTPLDAIKLVEYAYNCKWLRECLTECKTGKNRLPSLLPQGTIVGHKTGTGDITPDKHLHGINDVGFVMLPNGKHFTIAVFCDDSQMTLQDTEATIAKIALLAYNYLIETIK